QDMDDLDADLGILKPGSGTGKTTMKGPGKCKSLGGGVKTAGKLLGPEKGESVPAMEKKPLSSPAASPQYKKFKSEDLDDPLAGLLSDEEQDVPEKPAPTGTKSSSEKKTEQSKEKGKQESPSPQTPQHTVVPVRRAEKLMFEDDDDDLMDALGLGSGLKGDEKQGKKAEEEELRPARSKMDELLGRGSMAKILGQPGVGERKEFQLDKKYQKQPEKEEGLDKEDFVFGAYQPTVASTAKGRLSRRPSASRLSNENSSEPKPEPCSKPPLPASRSPVRSSRGGGNWLGLKDEDFMDSEPLSPEKPSPTGTAGRPGPASRVRAAEEAAAKPDPLEGESWLSSALARKKAQAQAKAQERHAKPSEAPGEGLDPHSPVSQPPASAGAPQQTAALQDKAVSADGSRRLVPGLSMMKEASAPPVESAKGDPSRDASAPVPTAMLPGEQETQGPALLAQVGLLGLCPRVSAAPVSLHERRLGAPAAQLYEDTSGCEAALRSAQARVAELECQVRTLELERMQHKLLLESLQQWHQEDLNLLESTCRSRVKMVEEIYRQQVERLQREKEQLEAQLLSQRRDAEQAQAELLAQHQQRLAALEQQDMLEMERLRELQRVTVQEMHKDHEEQLQRLKRLKDQEIDVMISTASPTRSLNGVMEQVEKFSSDLHELSHKIEAMYRATSQELAMGAQQWDTRLKVLQDSLLQQQRNMEEERSRFQEAITKMEARLDEQTRLLEQKRWRVTAEQSKVESLQHSAEEQQRVMTQQLATERAELDRAKSTLLEEQKSVMRKCSEERRKLAAEWAEFHTWKQLSKEQMDHDMDRAQQMDCLRESTIMSLGKEQADLKIQAHKLKAKEEQLTRDRELLDEAWHELRLEKKKVNMAALRIQQQEEEMKSKTKLLSQKYEFGEGALWEACRVDSEHRSKLQVMQQNLEQLKQQELRQQQEKLSMARERRQPEQLREKLHTNPMTLLTADVDLSAPTEGLSSTPWFPPSVKVLSRHVLESSRETLATANSTELYAKLLLLKHWAQQDHDFLEDEQFFLETLKKASYNTSCLSD
ncbi:FBF1 factor, partial [Corythaixoides concolor]|nr:FBF1 factor [Corythaixoides concolor]